MMPARALPTILLLVSLLLVSGPAYSLKPGLTAPEIAAERWHQTTEPPLIRDLEGKVVLLDFWGLWCPPCITALPALNKLDATFGDRGLVVIGVHTPAKADQLEAFLQENKVAFPVAEDTGRTAQRYQLRNYPTYVLIDRVGRIHATSFSIPDADTIDKLLLARP